MTLFLYRAGSLSPHSEHYWRYI